MGDHSRGSDSVQCVTDLNTCCSGAQGQHRGDWYFRTRLPFAGRGDIFQSRGAKRVDLRHRNNDNSSTGIYHCDIPTVAVHDYSDASVRDTLYVGLYTGSEGKPTLPTCLCMTLTHSHTWV